MTIETRPAKVRHHPFGPSSFLRRERCPGSLREEKGLPEISSDDATEGTRLHALIAACFRDEDLDGISSDDRDIVTRCVEFLDAHLVADWRNWGRIVEETIDAGDFFGTPDLILDDGDRVHVVNWKCGHKALEPGELTYQISLECALALHAHPEAEIAYGYAFNPRTGDEAHGFVGRAELPDLFATIRGVQAECASPDAALRTGSHCQYCRALGLCEVTREIAVSTVREIGPVADEIARWPAAKVAELAEHLHVLEQIAKATRARLHDLLEQDPSCLPGWERTERGGIRSADPVALLEAVGDVLPADEVFSHCSVSVAAVERSYVEKYRGENGGTKKAAEEAFRDATRDVVKQKTTHALRRVN